MAKGKKVSGAAATPEPKADPAQQKLLTIDITTVELIELMLGKTLNYKQIQEAFEAKHPGYTIFCAGIQHKIRALRLSPYVNIEKINGRAISYHLIRVGPEFLKCTARVKPMREENMVVRTGRFYPSEIECCALTEVFNSLLMPVRQRYQEARSLSQETA